MKRLLATFTLLFASSALAAQSLTGGLWTIHSNIAGNVSDQECKFVVTDNKITGTCNFQGKNLQVTGSVDGKRVTWHYENEMYGSTFTFNYSGNVDDSGKIAGTFLLEPVKVDGLFTATPGAAPPPSPSASVGWGKYPTQDPRAPGFVVAKELPDGANPSVNADGNFILGPTHTPAPEITAQPGVPQGRVIEFMMNSTESKIYPGIARDPGTFGTPDPTDPAKLIVTTSHPAPYTRHMAVYVPSQYKPGTTVPFIVGTDGPDRLLFKVLDNLIAQHRIPAIVAISIGSGGGDAQGSERGLEMDTMSGLFAEWVEKEVLPRVEAEAHVKLTHDPDGRATMGASSGGTCALIMAWYHPELYHRVLAVSGQFINQQWPYNSQAPHGGWEFPEHLVAGSSAKPIRIWMDIGDSDAVDPNVMRDHMHDSVLASERVAEALADKGYHYQFVFARNAGHVDGAVKMQTLPEALEYLWQGYPIGKK
jgi:enterochelin esterase-like enzyme